MRNPFDPGYFCSDEPRELGFAHVVKNVHIARNCTIVGLENIGLDDHARIDGYCTIVATGKLSIGAYVHIHTNCVIGARAGVELGDFVGISHGCRIFTASDDMSGDWLTNSNLPSGYTNPTVVRVTFGRYIPVGAGCTFLPGSTLGEGAAVYAHSLVSGEVEPWKIVAGVPAKTIKGRRRKSAILAAEIMERGNRMAA